MGAFKEIALDKDRRGSLLAVSIHLFINFQDATSLGGLVLLLSKENLTVTRDVLEVNQILLFTLRYFRLWLIVKMDQLIFQD